MVDGLSEPEDVYLRWTEYFRLLKVIDAGKKELVEPSTRFSKVIIYQQVIIRFVK